MKLGFRVYTKAGSVSPGCFGVKALGCSVLCILVVQDVRPFSGDAFVFNPWP